MNRQEIRARGERFRDGGCTGQSFSASLLDEIYRSIDDGGDKRSGELKFYRHNNALKKQGKMIGKTQSDVEDEEIASLHRALLIERWIEKKVAEKVNAQKRRSMTEAEMKFQLYQHDREDDALFFSSTSSSSDSSFGFSSSDTESMYGSKSLTPSCFAKFRPKPIRTSVSAPPPEKTEAKQRQSREKPQSKQSNRFIENKESQDFDENAIIKSKSRALKIYTNLKKVKQPISPGGRLSSFLNSIFTVGTPKKTGNSATSTTRASEDPHTERKSKPGQTSTCSSATSFSRSCLSKNSPCSSEKFINSDKRTVRFHPVSTIVDEHCRPCGHKSICEEEPKFQVKNNKTQTAEAARNFLTDYQQNMKKNDFLIRNFHHPDNDLCEEEEDDDDTGSCSSSDLFELDHLTVKSGNRYREELPVYEKTTRMNANRVIRHS